MDLGRLRSTDWIAGALGAALLGVMFLDWYQHPEFSAIDGERPPVALADLNAWQAFAVTDVVMALAAGMAVALAVVTATQQTPAVPVALGGLTALFTALASVFVFVRVLTVPEEGYTRDVGPTLGLALLLGLTLAAWFGMRNERPGHGSYARDARARMAEIETLPAPER